MIEKGRDNNNLVFDSILHWSNISYNTTRKAFRVGGFMEVVTNTRIDRWRRVDMGDIGHLAGVQMTHTELKAFTKGLLELKSSGLLSIVHSED